MTPSYPQLTACPDMNKGGLARSLMYSLLTTPVNIRPTLPQVHGRTYPETAPILTLDDLVGFVGAVLRWAVVFRSQEVGV